MYKIKNLDTGLYSTGGTRPRFTKKGKTWAEKRFVSSHLSLRVYNGSNLVQLRDHPIYSNCVLEHYETVLINQVPI